MRRSSPFSVDRATAWAIDSTQNLGRHSQSLRAALCVSLALTGLTAIGMPARAGGAPPKGSGGGPTTTYAYVIVYVDSAASGSQPAAPLSGATVTANGVNAPLSGASNEFLISTTPGASVNVTVTCSGYAKQTLTVTAGPAYSTVTQTVNLVATASTYPYAGVSGNLNDTVDATAPAVSTPVPYATVYLTVNGAAAGSSTTDAFGNYSIAVSGGIPTGASLSISTSAYGYNNASLSTTESGTASAAGTYYPLGTATATPNNQAVFFNGSMSYIYGCNYPSWEYADFAPHYLANWPPPLTDEDGYNYDFNNTETDTASPYYGQLLSIQQNFANMGALPAVNNSTPMRTVRWFLFSQMEYTLKWTGESSDIGSKSTSAYAKVATTGANSSTINPATGTTDPLLAGVTQSGLDYTTFNEIGLALQYAAQNNIRILFTFGTFYDLRSDSGNHRAVVSTTEVKSNGSAVGSGIQDSYVNNAVIPAMQYITAWEAANAGTYPKAKNVVFAYDVLNEPDQYTYGTINNYTLSGSYQGSPGNASNSLLSISDVQSFITRCAAAVHTYGGGALATGDTSAPQVAGLLQGCGLDFYCAHYYGFWNDATDSDPNTGYPTAWSLGSGLPSANTIGNGGGPLDKPCVIEEMQTAEQTNDTDGSGNHFTANWVLNQVHNLGYAGALGWGYTLSYAGNDEGSEIPGYTQATDPLSHWTYFEPFFTAWPGNNVFNPATGSGVVIGPN